MIVMILPFQKWCFLNCKSLHDLDLTLERISHQKYFYACCSSKWWLFSHLSLLGTGVGDRIYIFLAHHCFFHKLRWVCLWYHTEKNSQNHLPCHFLKIYSGRFIDKKINHSAAFNYIIIILTSFAKL